MAAVALPNLAESQDAAPRDTATSAQENVTAADATSTDCAAGFGPVVAKRIQKRYDAVRDMQADFAQTSVASTFRGEPLMSPDRKTGTVVFAKPGMMRWTYVAPEASEVVSNGSMLWIYDVEGQSVTKLAVTAGFLSGAAVQFLLGDGQILESFEVAARTCEPRRVELDLIPRADATYERLGLVADPETGEIIATSVLDLFGNLTRIEFSAIKVNQNPKASTFEFVVPDGVELLEYEGTPSR